MDGSGNAYVTGFTDSTNFPTTAGAFQTSNRGIYNAFVTKLNASGTGLAYSTYLGGSAGTFFHSDSGGGIAVDGSGNAYITGHACSTNFPTTAGAFQTSNHASSGASNAIVAKFTFAGPATHFTIAAPASATAGTGFSITVTALDAYNQTAIGYTGTVHFDSSDYQAMLPNNYTFTAADNGVHTFNVTLKTAGSRAVTSTDTLTSSITGNATVTVNPAAASTLVVASFPSPTTAGTSHSFTVTAQDAYGNTATGYTGTVRFGSTDPQAALPANSTLTSGTGTFTATLKTAGSQALTATDTVTGSITGSQTAITVTPAAASTLVVAGFPSSTTAGIAHSFTVTAKDPYGNTATAYSGTVRFSTSDLQATLPGPSTLTGGTGTFSATLKTAGRQSLTATDTSNSAITGTQTGILVTAAPVNSLAVSAPASMTAGSYGYFTVTAKDVYGNTATDYTGTVRVTSSDLLAYLEADYHFMSSDQGSHLFEVLFKAAASQTLTATDTGISSLQGRATVLVNPGPVSFFTLDAPATVTTGVPFTVTVTARDAHTNVVPTYANTVHFTSTDNRASLPPDYTFTAADQGVHRFTATLQSLGSQFVTATDHGGVKGVTGTSQFVLPGALNFAYITAGPDGNLWATDIANQIAKVTLAGAVTTYPVPTANSGLDRIAAGPDGNLWFTEQRGNRIGRITVTGTVTEFPVPTPASRPTGIAAGPDGNLWFTEGAGNKVGRITPSGTITEFAAPSGGSITAGPDGNLWYIESKLARITVTGTVTEFAVPSGLNLRGITAGPDGNVWFTEDSIRSSMIGRITPSGSITEFPLDYSVPLDNITAGPDGNLWFAQLGPEGLGRITPSGTITEFAAPRGGSITAAPDGNLWYGLSDPSGELARFHPAGIVVAPGPVARLDVANSAGTGTVAGTPFDVTVTARDASGNVATGYTGTVHFASADPYGATLPTDYTFTAADKGVHTFAAGAKLYTAGTWDVTATDTPNGVTGAASVNVVAAGLDHFGVSSSADSSGTVAGSPFDVTVTAQDAYNNSVSTYTGTVHFSSGDPYGASLPVDYTFQAADQGTAMFPGGAALYTAGTWDVTVADTTSGRSGSDNVAVTPAPAVAFAVTAPASAGAGMPFDVTVTAVDPYGNTDTNYQGTVTFSTTDTDPGVVLPPDYTFQPGDQGMVTFAGMTTLITPGDQSLTVTDTVSGISGSATVTVTAGPATPGVGSGKGPTAGISLPTVMGAFPAEGPGARLVSESPAGDPAPGAVAAVDWLFGDAGDRWLDPFRR